MHMKRHLWPTMSHNNSLLGVKPTQAACPKDFAELHEIFDFAVLTELVDSRTYLMGHIVPNIRFRDRKSVV